MSISGNKNFDPYAFLDSRHDDPFGHDFSVQKAGHAERQAEQLRATAPAVFDMGSLVVTSPVLADIGIEFPAMKRDRVALRRPLPEES
jgi:hypothetical protein